VPTDIQDIETKLWAAADELRANSRLKFSQAMTPPGLDRHNPLPYRPLIWLVAIMTPMTTTAATSPNSTAYE